MRTSSAPDNECRESSLRIAAVVEDTGLSKELIHHYLRQGLIPKSTSRARYDEQQVRLLHLIRKLREEHFLPLELIRSLFQSFGFDPVRLENLTFTESLGARMIRFATGDGLLPPQALTADQVAAHAGITSERLEEYIGARLAHPETTNGQHRFSIYDANTISLCERGIELGVPFESFRTIGSYIRIAFELEFQEFFNSSHVTTKQGSRLLEDMFVRSEIVFGFVQNMLSTVCNRHLRLILVSGGAQPVTLDEIVYRPSDAFVRHHRLQEQLDTTLEAMTTTSDEIEHWLEMGRLLLHAGRYHEAAFFLGEALDKWPFDETVNELFGRALVLSREHERGQEQLERAATGPSPLPSARLFQLLSLFIQASAEDNPDRLLHVAERITNQLDELLLDTPRSTPPNMVENHVLAGWLLTALPPMFRQWTRGLKLLVEIWSQLVDSGSKCNQQLTRERQAGVAARLRINTAFLLFESLSRLEREGVAESVELPSGTPSITELSTTIVRLDPQCAFAETVFLRTDDEGDLDSTR